MIFRFERGNRLNGISIWIFYRTRLAIALLIQSLDRINRITQMGGREWAASA